MAGISPTQNSLKRLRKAGYEAGVVEKWVPQARRRIDLWGFVDIVAVHPTAGLVMCQTTTAGNMASRMSKAAKIPAAGYCVSAGVTVEVHGWKKERGLWVCRVATFDGAGWAVAWD